MVQSVETKLREHLDRGGLGLPFHEKRTVSEVVNEITANQGGFVRGPALQAWDVTIDAISRMVEKSRADDVEQYGLAAIPNLEGTTAVGSIGTSAVFAARRPSGSSSAPPTSRSGPPATDVHQMDLQTIQMERQLLKARQDLLEKELESRMGATSMLEDFESSKARDSVAGASSRPPSGSKSMGKSAKIFPENMI